MTQSFFRALFASLAATVMFVATPAPAATLTFTDNNCASFSVTGSAPTFTLVCQSLACTLSASPAAPTPGQTTTMTASCSGGTGAITFSNWISATGGCPPVNGAGAVGTAMSGIAVGPCTYRVTGTDTASLSGTASTNVTWSSTPPAVPSGCTLTPSTASLPAGGGNVTLTSACSGGGAPTSYAWTGAGVVTPTAANSQIVNVTATTTFGVTPSNGSGAGNTATAGVTVGGGGGGTLPATCNIGGTTYNVLDLNGQNSIGTLPFSTPTISSGFGGSKVLIATLIPPAGLSTKTNTMTVYEWGSASTSRKAWLARSPCDTSGTYPYYQATSSPVFNYTIGGTDSSAVNMQPGEKWYLIVINQKPFGGSSCSSGSCDVGIKWYPPN
jgi:hypothetical protein